MTAARMAFLEEPWWWALVAILLMTLGLIISGSGCSSYTAAQTRECVTASVAAARHDIVAVRSCMAADRDRSEASISACIDAAAQAALADTEAALACVPAGSSSPDLR